MRVLFDHQIFSYQTFGGISRYFFELMNQFVDFGDAECELAVRYSDNAYIKSLRGARRYESLGTFKPGSRSRFFATYFLNRRLSARSLEKGDFDVLHPTFYDDYFLQRLRGKPFVLTLMDMTPELFPELFPTNSLYGRLVTARWINAKRELARRASGIIAISENTKQDAIRCYGIDASRIEVIHLASSLVPSAGAFRESPAAGRPFVLFVGGRAGYKNFAAFADAMRPVLLRDGELRVICAGGGRFSESERHMLGRLGLAGRFEQTDVTDGQLAGLYVAARAFVFPSRHEGFGIPIVEAFNCGCPCVLSDASCFPEIAGEAAAYFDPGQVPALTAAVERVLFDDAYRMGLVERGRERARLFSWRNTALRTLAAYERAAGRPAGRA